MISGAAFIGMPGVARAANITYLTMQVRQGERDVRTMVTGITVGEPGTPGWPPYLVAGRQITRGHYEAVADITTGFKLGDRIQIRRNHYTVVGLTRRMVSSGGDPMVFIPLKDAQEAQFLKDNDAIRQQRRRTAANPAFNRPQVPGLLDAVIASQSTNPYVNAVLVQIEPDHTAADVAESIRRWKRLTVYTRSPDGGDSGRQTDCHLGQTDRHVFGDPFDCQRSHCRLYHLHPDPR